jgi:UDP-N-acetylglucosamine--N-acetylmuramyl-(pentapeptide) pyrophosphoryl-undecaprenol N-acetylglucosamine transferase
MQAGGAARLVPDTDLTGERLAQVVLELAGDEGRLAKMAEAARRFARPGAARRAADLLEEAAGLADGIARAG